MNLIIGVVVIGIIIAGIAFFMASKSDSKNTAKEELQSTAKRESQSRTQEELQSTAKRESQSRIQGESQGTTQKESQNISIKEEASADMQAVKQKEQLYHYMTQELQNLFYVYNKEEWNQLKKLGEISQELYKEKNDIIEGLSTVTGRMVKEYFTCVDFREEEGKLVGYVNDIEKLKQVFLQFMMPFYPYYYKELSEGDFVILRFSIRIRCVCSSSLPVKSSDQDIEIAIPQVFVLLSGIKIGIKYMEKMEDFYVMLFLVRME